MPNEHHDEKGRFSAAQSSVARGMSGRKPLLPMSEHQRSMLGKTMGGMAREQEAAHNYSKVLRKDPTPGRYNYGGTTRKKHGEKLKVIARGKRNEYRKAYTKIGARMHKRGLLKAK